MKYFWRWLLVFSLLVSVATAAGGEMRFQLSSPVFSEGGEIPSRYTCEGEDISPPLIWSGVPDGAKSLVLIVDDPDAPDPAAPRMTWVHWLVYNLPASDGGLPEGVTESQLPPGTLLGVNDFKRTRYGGPCPPIGRHRYFFKVYALNTQLPDLHVPDKPTLLRAMQSHVLAETVLMGTYQKHQR